MHSITFLLATYLLVDIWQDDLPRLYLDDGQDRSSGLQE